MKDAVPISTSAGHPGPVGPAPAAPPPPASAEPLPPPAASPAAPIPKPAGVPSTLFPQAKGESDRAFEAFCAYLELGPKRRYTAVGKIVGASLRTVKRWATDFDWRGRIKTYAAQGAEQYVETENTVQREDLLDAAARAKAFRDRQYALAEAILDAAERHLERVDDDDLDQMSFADACKALAVASRLGGEAAGREIGDSAAPARGLRDQLAALLEQAYSETPSGSGAGGQPQSAKPTPAQS